MATLRPRVSGWGLAAGVILWLEAALAVFLGVSLWPNDPAGELPLLILAIAGVTVLIAIGFWRGAGWARWLAILPALALFLAALVWFGLQSICAAGLPPGGQPTPDLLSCGPPPELTIGLLLTRFGIPLGLAVLGVVVLVGMRRPGVREPGHPGSP